MPYHPNVNAADASELPRIRQEMADLRATGKLIIIASHTREVVGSIKHETPIGVPVRIVSERTPKEYIENSWQPLQAASDVLQGGHVGFYEIEALD